MLCVGWVKGFMNVVYWVGKGLCECCVGWVKGFVNVVCWGKRLYVCCVLGG
jgi:hypothetical protein